MDTIRKAGALLFKEGRLLLVKSHGKPYFITPGGKYEEGENAEDCLKRELMEELQVEISLIKHYKDYYFKKAAHSDNPLTIGLYIIEIQGEPKVSREVETMEWISKEDFQNKKFNVAPSFDTFLPDFIKTGYCRNYF